VQLAYRLYLDHQYEQAELESRKLLEWEPGIPWSYTCQASVFLQTGRKQEAVAELRKAAALPASGVYEQMYLGHARRVGETRCTLDFPWLVSAVSSFVPV
jgi:hypothetical protein